MDDLSIRRGARPALHDLGALLLLLFTAGLLFFAQPRSPLLEPEDAFYAEVPRQMLERGDWLIPTHEGRPYYQKPPLLYWLIMAGYAAFGVHDWVARLIPCFSGLGIILVTFWWGKRTLGYRAGLAGALILCLSARFVHQTRMITMDGLLCFWILSGLALGQQAIQTGRLGWRLWLFSAVACALALLTKGPVALILVAVPLLAYQFLNRNTARPMVRSWLAYLGTALALSLPWYVAAACRDPVFFRDFFWDHHVVLRFVQPMHEQPVWFYLPALLLGMVPWIFLAPDLIVILFRRSGERKWPAELGFLLLCCSWCLVFFSAAPCKRIGYILPAMPTLALALGYVLDRRLPGQTLSDFFRSDGKRTLSFLASQSVLATAILVSLIAGFTGLAEPAQGVGLAVLAAAGMAWLVIRCRRPTPVQPRWRWEGSWGACALATFLLLFLTVHVLLPGYYRRFSLRAQVRSLMDSSYTGRIPVICHPHHCDSVSFYLGRNDIRSFSRDQRDQMIADLRRRPETIVFVKTGRVLKELLSLLPDSLQFVATGRSSWITAGRIIRRNLISEAEPPKIE